MKHFNVQGNMPVGIKAELVQVHAVCSGIHEYKLFELFEAQLFQFSVKNRLKNTCKVGTLFSYNGE